MADNPDHPLNEQQTLLVETIINHPEYTNAKLAEVTGYTLATVCSAKCEANIVKAIEEGKRRRTEALGLSEGRILEELMKIAFADIGEFYTQDADGNISIDMNKLIRGQTSILQELSVKQVNGKTKIRDIRIKPADKMAALQMIGKYLGMFKEKVEVETKLSLEQLIEKSFEDGVKS